MSEPESLYVLTTDPRMKRLLVILLIAEALCGIGCGSGNSGSGGSGSSNANLAGVWQFTINSTPYQGTVTLLNGTVIQSGNSFSSSIIALDSSVEGLPCNINGADITNGMVSGSSVTFQLNEGTPPPTIVQVLNFNGQVTANASQMSGNWTAMAGTCANAGDTGTWSATKTIVTTLRQRTTRHRPSGLSEPA